MTISHRRSNLFSDSFFQIEPLNYSHSMVLMCVCVLIINFDENKSHDSDSLRWLQRKRGTRIIYSDDHNSNKSQNTSWTRHININTRLKLNIQKVANRFSHMPKNKEKKNSRNKNHFNTNDHWIFESPLWLRILFFNTTLLLLFTVQRFLFRQWKSLLFNLFCLKRKLLLSKNVFHYLKMASHYSQSMAVNVSK